jgi:WXG100 family type VII secretion target
MAGTNVRTDFEQMTDIQNRWKAEADATLGSIQQLQRTIQLLNGGDWYGEAASKFYAEMEAVVMPSLTRLEQALREAATASAQIAQLMQAAEQECAAVLNGSSV